MAAVAVAVTAHGQIVMDGKLGAAGALSGPAFQITPDLGRQMGANLFHSFSQFNLSQGQSATFSGPANVQNILARVTGGSASSIDGTLRSTITGANLFLLNPNGILFGPNAALDVSGSFVASTADYLKLADGGRFDARNPDSSVLTAAPVEKFGFLGTAAGGIQLQGSRLAVGSGQTLGLVAGEITIVGGQLIAPGGAVYLAGKAAAGEITLAPDFTSAIPALTDGSVAITSGSAITVEGTAAGSIGLQAGAILVDASSLTIRASAVQPTPASPGSGLVILAGVLGMANGGSAISSSAGQADGAGIKVLATSVAINGYGTTTTLGSEVAVGGSGRGGDVQIRADTVELYQGGRINSVTRGTGAGGAITVNASIVLADMIGPVFTGTGFYSESYAAGPAGDVNLTLGPGSLLADPGTLVLRRGAQMTSISHDSGATGNLTVEASTVLLDGQGFFNTGISLFRFGEGGRPGQIVVNARQGALQVAGMGVISSSGIGEGNEGGVTITAGSLLLDGQGYSGQTGIYTANTLFGGAGASVAGPISIDVGTGDIVVTRGAQIRSATSTAGAGGAITVRGGTLTLTGASDDLPASIAATTSSTGRAGDVSIELRGLLTIQDGATVTTITSGAGASGNISVRAGGILVDGMGSEFNTGLIASSETETSPAGRAGNIAIDLGAGELRVRNGGSVATPTFGPAAGGSISIRAGAVTVERAGSVEFTGITAESLNSGAGGPAGNIDIDLGSGTLRTVGDVRISTSTFGLGTGGNIAIRAGTLLLDGGHVPAANGITATTQATGAGGPAGNIRIEATRIEMVRGSRISTSTAGSGAAGNLEVFAHEVLVDGTKLTSLFTPEVTAISSITVGSGAAGNVMVDAGNGSIVLLNGGGIGSTSFALGPGGSVTVRAGTLTLSGQSGFYVAGIGADSAGATGTRAGDVLVEVAGVLTLSDYGRISSLTGNSGPGGSVTVRAGSITIDAAGTDQALGTTSISAQSFNPSSGGNAGNVVVNVGSGVLQMQNGGQIISDTKNQGAGGDITITAGTIFVNGGNRTDAETGIIAASRRFEGGAAGTIRLTADRIELSNLGVISSSTAGTGNGGSLILQTGVLKLSSGAAITALTSGPGRGGSIDITATSVELDGSDGRRTRIAVDTEGRGQQLISDLNVFLDLQHTYDSDLILSLISPLGTEVFLANRVGGDGDGFANTRFSSTATTPIQSGTAPFAGIYAPQGNLSQFNGTPINGTWILKIQDVGSGDQGTLGRWGLGSGSPQLFSPNVPRAITDFATTLSALTVALPPDAFGAGGNVSLATGSLRLTGRAEISGQTKNSSPGGNLQLTATTTELLAGAKLTTATLGSGHAGDLTLTSGSLVVNGTGATAFTGIASESNLGATGDAGKLTVTVADHLQLLSNGRITSSTYGTGKAGEVTVRAGRLTIVGSGTEVADETYTGIASGNVSTTTGGGDAGDVSVVVRGELLMLRNGRIASSSDVSGNAGNITVTAQTLTIDGRDGDNSAGIFSEGGTITGNGGAIDVQVREATSVSNGGGISTTTFGAGQAGNVTLGAASMLIGGNNQVGYFSVVFSQCALGATGNAGNVTVLVPGEVRIMHSGGISTDTFGAGNAGSILLRADSLHIEGQSSQFEAGIASRSGLGQAGSAGIVTVEIQNQLTILKGSGISSDSFGAGRAGNVTVTAGTLTIDSQGSTERTGIVSDSLSTGAGGNAGTVTVDVRGPVQVRDKGRISSDTKGAGNAGQVRVATQGELQLQGNGRISSSSTVTGNAGNITVSSQTLALDGLDGVAAPGIFSEGGTVTGNGGTIDVRVQGAAILQRGGQISSTTFGTGRGGDITVGAASLLIDGANQRFNAAIFSQSAASGDAGSITILVPGEVRILTSGGISTDAFSSGDAGSVLIRAGTMHLEGRAGGGNLGIASRSNGPTGDAGSITVEIQDSLTILRGAGITSDTSGAGKAGTVTLTARTLMMDGQGSSVLTGIASDSLSTGIGGDAGTIRITVSGGVDLRNGAGISSDTHSSGKAGDIVLTTGTLRVAGANAMSAARISSESLLGATGAAGSVRLAGDVIEISDRSFISTATAGPGNGGLIGIQTGTLKLSGGAEISAVTRGAGRGGSIEITAQTVELDGSSGTRTRIAADTEGSPAGLIRDLTVQLDLQHTYDADLILSLISPTGTEVLLANQVGGGGNGFASTRFSSTAPTSIRSGTAPFTGTFAPQGSLSQFNGTSINGTWILKIQDIGFGDQGTLTRWGLGSGSPQHFSADVPKPISDLSTTLSALVLADSFGQGGNVTLVTDNLRLTGAAEISAQTKNSAPGGNLSVRAASVSLLAGARLNTTTIGSGRGGDIVLNAGSLLVSSGAAIDAASTGTGDAGSVNIRAEGDILLRGDSEIASSSALSNAGGINVRSGTRIQLENSQITSRAASDGGGITLMAPHQIHFFRSRVTSEAGGAGGDIFIDPQTVSLNQSTISANAVALNAGSITINTSFLLRSQDSQITASSQFGLNGTVSILGPSVDLSGSLITLSSGLLGAESRLPERCAVRLPGNFSSFISVGRGGLPLEPADFQPSFIFLKDKEEQK